MAVSLPPGSAPGRPSLTLNLGLGGGGLDDPAGSPRKRMGLCLNLPGSNFITAGGDHVDVSLALERQGWYHGAITRLEAENILRLLREGSYLVRNSESTRQDYSLSLKSARGFMHMRIQQNKETGKFILGQFSKPFDSIPEMIHHYTINRLPIRGAEHMCLLHPVIEQLL
ncbi:Protein E(sev)2B [Gryllus bimaculatus]|nr:Protein E(sev)2B [Gryllus bimaculatus]